MATVNARRSPTRLNGAFSDDNASSSAGANGRHVAGQMRQKLQALLDEKERQLQQAEALSQRVLAQQMELEERINQIADLDETGGPSNDEGESEIRAQLDELAQTMHGWATENETLWAGAVTKDAPGDTSGIPHYESDAQPAAHTPSAAQSSRRAKNAAHRANDVEFAFEIGSGLLTEIRRLQSLLAERDKTLQDMKDERDDMDRSIEQLRGALRTQEANADKYKEENWNLEVQLQEVRAQMNKTQSALERSETEQRVAQKQMTTLRETSESHKIESERLNNQLTELKSKHETNVAQMRKQAATLQREKGELQANVETLKAEVAKKAKTVARFGSPMTPNDNRYLTPARATEFGEEDGEDVFGTVGSTRRRMDSSLVFGDGYDLDLDALSPDVSPIKNSSLSGKSPAIPNHAASEIEALKQSLAHAHRQLGTLKTSLARERQLRTDYGRKLEGYGANVEAVEGMDEGDDEDFQDEPGELPRVTPLRSGRGGARGGRLRTGGPGRTSLAAKLAKAAKAGQAAPQFDSAHELPVADFSMTDQEEWVDVDEQTGAVPTGRRSEDRQSVAESVDLDEDSRRRSIDDLGRKQKTQSMLSVASSMDGMDPVFANVLKRKDSHRASNEVGRTSMDSQHTIEQGKKKKTRKALDESRPGSVFEAPGTLASELGGLADASTVADDDRLRAELGLGDEDIEEIEEDVEEDEDEDIEAEELLSASHASVAHKAQPPVKVQTEEMGIQCDLLLPPPPPPPVAEQASIAIQTDDVSPPVLPAVQEAGMQTDSPVLENVAVATDPQPQRQYATSGVSTVDSARNSMVRKVPIEVVGAAGAAGAIAGAAAATSSSKNAEKRASRTVPPSAFKDPVDRSVSRADTVSDGGTEYEDARETLGATTPAQSFGEDYQSINDSDHTDSGTETDSAESIKVSLMHIKRPAVGPGSESSMKVPIRDVSARIAEGEDEEQSDKRDTIRPEQVIKIVEVEKPKPEVKEVSIQTDDWKPALPAGTQLFALGPQSQQFQFVSGPTTPIVGSPPLPAAAAALKQGGQQARSPTTVNASSGSISDLTRSRVPSTSLSVPSSPKAVDRTKPPTMILPPPPRLPPPPTTSPTLVSGGSILKHGPPNMGPPPRPTSPPPTELIQRATTPTMSRNSTLLVPGRTISQASRPSNASMVSPIPVQGRQVRSAVNGIGAGNEPNVLQDPFDEGTSHNIGRSMASLASGRRSVSSRRPSIASSISSDHAGRMSEAPKSMIHISSNPSEVVRRPGENATDPAIIHAITQTMIGEYLYKYTRKPIGKKHAERRHRRYFWIHPYTKTIYWSAVDPGSSNVQESSAKSAYIESVKSVMDPNPMPPGLHQYSVIVTTANREMKFTAPTKERHDIWFNALNYLLARPSPNTLAAHSADAPASSNLQRQTTQQNDDVQRMQYSPRSPRSGQSALTVDSYGAAQPRPPRSISRMSNPYGSVSKRTGTAAAEFMRWNGDAPASPSKVDDRVNPPDGDFHIHDDNDVAYDGLENVRACCDGKHDTFMEQQSEIPAENRRIRCKMCRRTLAGRTNLSGHHPQEGTVAEQLENENENNEHDTPTALMSPHCSGYFVQPLQWMTFLGDGSSTGKILCPNERCKAKVGNYDWAGVKCSCGEWVTPVRAKKAQLSPWLYI
ncbi:hypothetical protein FRC17_001904 [Serendipita sp. 399]|nr:hypothetical protein FRC17_001904 [Serendipita sp. 399]